MFLKKVFVVFAVFFIVPFSFLSAGYYDDSIVPCGPKGPQCTLCYFIKMGQNIFDGILKISIAVALLMLAISGILYIVSSGSEAVMTIAKNALKYTVVGFIFCLVAWVLVNLTGVLLGFQWKDKWWKFEFDCPEVVVAGMMVVVKAGDPAYDAGHGEEKYPVPASCDSGQKDVEAADLCKNILTKSAKLVDTSFQPGVHVLPDLQQCASQDGCVISGKGSTCGQKKVILNKNILKGLLAVLEDPTVGTVGVSAVAGGVHSSCGSSHYNGQALDISRIDGDKTRLQEIGSKYFSQCSPGSELPNHLHLNSCL